jgi:DNA ligase-1
MEQSNNKYRTISGLDDGEKVTTNWTVAEGKNIGKTNETNPIEQAAKEIASAYKDQESTGYHKNIQDIDTETYFSPMLAKQWEDRKDEVNWENGNYISPKMDGLRAVITKSGAASRNGKKFYSFPHILKELEPLFELYPDLILDGEIYCDKLANDFNKIISLAKKSKPTQEDLDESSQFIQYWIFDNPSTKFGFHDRYEYVTDLINTHLPNNKYIKICEHTLIESPKEIETNLQKYLRAGFEGLMLNIYDGKYEQKRSKNILKYKLFQDCEAEITDIIEGLGNRSKMFGYAKLRLDNGKEFDSNARGNEESYKKILKNKADYIGKRATIRYQNLTPDGIPRFPVIIDFDRFD